MWVYLDFFIQLAIAIAVTAFILYDSRKKRKDEYDPYKEDTSDQGTDSR
jgi:hypothetical protein